MSNKYILLSVLLGAVIVTTIGFRYFKANPVFVQTGPDTRSFELPMEWGDQLTSPYWVGVEAIDRVSAIQDEDVRLTMTISNEGTEADSYEVLASSVGGNVQIISTPPPVSLAAGETRSVVVVVRASDNSFTGNEAEVELMARSTSGPSINDTAYTILKVRATQNNSGRTVEF